ncbi:hypothetical protein F3Y22_tig00110383pilonHSYRG00183 [Hibiscus syriacus]|uniref:Protein E6 n=1 Tax=Hibiscus syriacus TaxID=106335 RepID=A0A6A3AXP1_HIBSY|nr:hypothetical protein F3Y22_tig00110383pilonHSYRG00183 [Hibiscus syriacus]
MASSPKFISLLFLFALFSMQINAGEFFSKIPTVNTNIEQETTTRDQEHGTQTPEEQQQSLSPKPKMVMAFTGTEQAQTSPVSPPKKLMNHMFTEKGWSTKENQNKYNGNNGYSNGEKEGMSDIRYLENGKYYYDVKSERNYYPNQFENTRRVASRNEFDENRYNNMGRYNQNQEEFEDTEEEFEP